MDDSTWHGDWQKLIEMVKSPPEDCVELGHLRGRGYRAIGAGWLTHRLAWQKYHQKRLTSEQVIHHKCNNRACCNPLHLEMFESAVLHGRHHGNFTWCENGHPRLREGARCVACVAGIEAIEAH